MNVLMLPDYRADNPYQELLRNALAEVDCQVTFLTGYRRVFPLWRAARAMPAAQLLHLHWTSPYVRHAGPISGWIYSLKLLVDLQLVKLTGRPIVWTLHNLIPHDHSHPKRERWLRRQLCKLASSVIVHSENGRLEAIRQFACPPDRVRVIPHGHYRTVYGPAQEPAAARKALNLEHAGRVFLLFGLLRPYKGIERLLKAWKEAVSDQNHEDNTSTLLIAGEFLDDNYGRRIEQLISETPQVRLIAGRVPNEQVAGYFSAADVAVFPFERIQTSGSILLALSFGLPVIAPRLGDVPETLTGADDLLFPSEDANGLAEQLTKAQRVDLADLRLRTRQICDRLDWSSIGERTAEVYEQAFGQVAMATATE